MSLPNSTGISVADLQTGQIIYVNGEEKTVADIDGFSGICTDGTVLNCNNPAKIETTEEFASEIVLTEAAAELLDTHGLLEGVQAKIDEYNKN